jgi:hypothetical protein
VTEDTVTETAVVQDHLGQVHSARVSTFRGGQLAEEAAALYLPPGLSAPRQPGSPTPSTVSCMGLAALRCSRDSAVSGGSAGGAGSATPPCGPDGGTLQGCQVVGYSLRGGRTTWGLLRDPAALGLPQQRAVTRTSFECVLAPRWQAAPACPTSSASTPLCSSQPGRSPAAVLPAGHPPQHPPTSCPPQALCSAGPLQAASGEVLQARPSR